MALKCKYIQISELGHTRKAEFLTLSSQKFCDLGMKYYRDPLVSGENKNKHVQICGEQIRNFAN